MATRQQVDAVLERRLHREGGVPTCYPSYDEVAGRLTEPGLTFYVGIDATSEHLHIGHTIALLFLRDLVGLGHQVTVLFGDFTSRIGDPTDKAAARTAQAPEEVEHHMRTYQVQVEKILQSGTFTVRRNSEWLATMTFSDVASLAAQVTVRQMLARDMFQERMRQEKPIFVSEFLYPLMQGYDSVAMEIDGEVGGSDQTFNMLVGRDLARTLISKDKMVLPLRLLVDASTGKKVSKSEGGFIALDDDPGAIFEKVGLSIPNEMIRTVFELATDVPMKEVGERFREAEESGDMRTYNLDLAETLVRMYYDEETAKKARADYDALTQEGAAESIPVREVSATNSTMSAISAQAFGISRSEATRLIEQGGISLNNRVAEDPLEPVAINTGDTIRIGSRRPVKLKVK